MTRCERIFQDATGLAAVPSLDPERVEAVAHAQGCVACARALREGDALLSLIHAGLRPDPAPADLLARAQAASLRLIDAKPGGAAPLVRRLRPTWAAAAILAFGLFVLIARHRHADGWGVALVAAMAGAALAALAESGTVVLIAACAGSGALALVAAAAPGLFPLVGLKCLAIEVVAASLPFAASALTRGLVPRPSTALTGAALAASCALAAQAALHLTCPVHDAVPHLLLFHVGGVALAALLGWRLLVRPQDSLTA